jgi:hypothetical protein
MPLQLAVSAAPSVFVLTRDLGEMFGPGYGGMLNIGLRNFMFQNFEAGINSGYFVFKGKEEKNTDSMTMLTTAAYAGYHLLIGDWFSLFPFAKLGGSYSSVKYTSLAFEKEKTIIDPLAAAGLSLTAGSDRLTFSVGADYGFLYESAGVKPFYEGFVSCGVKFEL